MNRPLTSAHNLYLRDMRDPWRVGPGAFGAWVAVTMICIAFCAGTDWIVP